MDIDPKVMRLIESIISSQEIIKEYLLPNSTCTADQTLTALIEVLDNSDLVASINGFRHVHDARGEDKDVCNKCGAYFMNDIHLRNI